MSPPNADTSETWPFLEEGINQIMMALPIPYVYFISIYTVTYNFCTSDPEGRIQVDDLPDAGCRTGTSLSGYIMYHKLLQYFNSYLEVLKERSETLQDEPLLRYYATEWERYTRGASYVDRAFTYPNRCWVKRERDEGQKGVYPVYTLALVQWKAVLFDDLQGKTGRLVGIVLRLVGRERNGETIDHALVKEIVDSFVSLGVDDAGVKKALLDIYREHLEVPVLVAIEKYREPGPEVIFVENNFSDFLKEVDDRLLEEAPRFDRYLDSETRTRLLGWQVPPWYLLKESSNLLVRGKLEDLRRLYTVSLRAHWGLDPLRTQFGEHAKEAGMNSVLKLIGEDTESTNGLDLGAYVDALFEVHQKYSKIIAECFMGEVGFFASLDKACGKLVNCNNATGPSDIRSAELLANYADKPLRRKDKAADKGSLESSLHQLGVLFRYIEDKGIFLEIYSMGLVKRLVYGLSVSVEAEASVVSKLKGVCGLEYTSKLERMITAVNVSKDIVNRFNKSMQRDTSDTSVNFDIMIPGTNCWPLRLPNTDFTIPPETVPTYEHFSKYYQMRHNGRKLTWLWNYSKAELTTGYLDRKYILMTSSYQMAILLQYNKHDTLTLDGPVVATATKKDILIKALALLVKAQIIVSPTTDKYDLNPNFKHAKIQVNLNQPIRVETRVESTEVLKTVSEERKYVIQASIDHESRKKMKNQALIQEVVSQLSRRFAPKISDIKKEIDVLLERDYVARMDGATDTFVYAG